MLEEDIGLLPSVCELQVMLCRIFPEYYAICTYGDILPEISNLMIESREVSRMLPFDPSFRAV